jgi:hypothetical protein
MDLAVAPGAELSIAGRGGTRARSLVEGEQNVGPRALEVEERVTRVASRDKARLQMDDVSQATWTARLLPSVCAEVACACLPEQHIAIDHETGLPIRTIHDLVPNEDPQGGLPAARLDRPDAAWLAVACELPLLTGGPTGARQRQHTRGADAGAVMELIPQTGGGRQDRAVP